MWINETVVHLLVENHISIFVRIASLGRKEHDHPPPQDFPPTPTAPAICVISRFYTKPIVFQKYF